MILFAILLGLLIAIAITVAAVAIIAGGSIALVFGDLIICCAIIWMIVKLFRKKK